MLKKNLYIFILTALFLGTAKILNLVNLWHIIGIPHPHGYEVQGLLFLAVLFILQNFLFDPYLQMLEMREEMTVHKKEHAEKTKIKADAMIASYQKSIADARIQATLERERIALQGEEEERVKIASAKKEGSQRINKALSQLEGESKKVRSELVGQVDQLSKEIIDHVSTPGSSEKGYGNSTPMYVAGKE